MLQNEQSFKYITSYTFENSDQVLQVKSELPGPGEDDFQVSLLWLRENCRCTTCYNEETHQRNFLVTDLNLDLRAKYVTLVQDAVTVLWYDDHKSTYNLSELVSNLSPTPCQPNVHLWDATSIGALLGKLTAAEVMKESGQRRLLESIFVYGLAIVDEVEPSVEATQALVSCITPHIRHTLFGSMWKFSDNSEHADTAYTNQHLDVHTDNTYFQDPSGLQVFHVLQPATQGGDTLLADGFHAASILRSHNKQAYDTLVNTLAEFEYIDSSHHYTARHSVLGISSVTGRLESVRFNLYDRSPRVSSPSSPHSIHKFYSSLQLFSRILHSPSSVYTLRLAPGQVLLMNNWRVLHGRTQYNGPRQVTGCYVTMENLMSIGRLLKLIK